MATAEQTIKRLEKYADLVDDLRSAAKTETGRLTPLGVSLIDALAGGGYQQAQIARLLDITPAAVSQRARGPLRRESHA